VGTLARTPVLERWNIAGLAARLRCPSCGLPVTALSDGSGYACSNGHQMAFRDGYLVADGPAGKDAVSQRTAESFGYEWTTFDDIRPEDNFFASWYLADLRLNELVGKVGLDAGCGKGRYTRHLAPHLAVLVALDASAAIEVATRDLASFDNVVTVRSDLRSAPFAAASFDFVSSLGVLHHLDDPAAGFRFLSGLLAPGGVLFLYLYSRPSRHGVRWAGIELATLFRRLTVRMDKRALRGLSAAVAGVLRVTLVTPGAWGDDWGMAWLTKLPLAVYRRRSFRSLWLDTFDRLSAPVEHRYLWSDLEPWFAAEGLAVESVRDEAGFFIVARRPLAR
jgi:SAM-dependent methyltransferase